MSGVFRFDEKPTSRSMTHEPPTITYLYTLAGTQEHGIAWAYAYSATPTMVAAAGSALYRQDVRVSAVGYDLWDVEVPYGKLDKTTGQYRFSFNTTGGTVRITQAKSHIATFPAGGPDHGGAIDVDGREVKGADIVIPALKLSYTFRHPLGIVNEALAVRLARITGQVNSATWHGFLAGEALFLGCNGSGGTDTESEVTYEIACSQNLTSATIGGITGVNKKGWEISWVSFADAVDGGKPVREAEYIYVERVYDTFNFAQQLGF